ncbi:hypothetical protein DL98DRAFT_514254 [Cadophora sp. DSE1049]|nr:hypothetical protein DL98DRAFT_514254 [Cadophora sp. DSE1049]
MKFTTIAIAAILPFLAVAAPAPADAEPTVDPVKSIERDVETSNIGKRSVSATVRVDGLRYRTCPKTSCTAVGQYAKGTKITLVCYTRVGTTTVNGDKGWAKLPSGYWVAMANGEYVGWSGSIYACP